MAQVDDLQNALNTMGASLADAKTRITEDVAVLEQTISELRAGDALEDAQLAAMTTQVESLRADVDSIDPTPPVVEPEPPVEPTP